MDPLGAGAALHQLALPDHISSAHRAGKDEASVGMDITTHQQKEKKASKRKAEEDRRQVMDFKEAACCPSAVIQGAAWQKMKGNVWGNWDPWEGQQPFLPNLNRAGDCTTMLRQLLIGVGQFGFRQIILTFLTSKDF